MGQLASSLGGPETLVTHPASTTHRQFAPDALAAAGIGEAVWRAAWRSTSGDAPNAGSVRFEPIGAEKTRVRLTMEYEPQGAVENAGDALGVMSRRVQTSVEQFKEYIEKRGAESGGWRGEVHGGQKKPRH